ncbi:serine/threonine-protein kinase [Nocardia sp. NPDC059240]|uniref:serine/threonine-protein kinase n=1 Tax=Nocardia sp. NPDC059240 TaxID=3346786 RepID=UPI0036B2CE2C
MEGNPFGHYRLRRKLGEGGMGQVFEAYDTHTDRVVALKVLPEHSADNPEFRERFRRESRSAAALNDPHVIPIHGFGEIDGRLYLDMRLVDGSGMDAVLAQYGPMAPAAAVAIIEQVAEALTAAHSQGLIHRDVKPSNILVSASGFVYLIDFGIARVVAETGLTSVGAAIGTFAYMAPERLSIGQADARSDVYSLACVLYECLTGAKPYPAVSMEQQIAGHLTGQAPRPSSICPDVPIAFDEIIARGLAKDPTQRYQAATELAAAARFALVPVAVQEAATVRIQPSPFAKTSGSMGSAAAVRDTGRLRRNRIILSAIATVTAVAVTGACVWYTTRPDPHSPRLTAIDVGGVPTNVVMDPIAHTAFVTNNNNSISVIDTTSRTVIDTIKADGGLGCVALDPGTQFAYVNNIKDLEVVDAAARKFTETIRIPWGTPTKVLVDPGTHTVYVVSQTGGWSVVDPVSRTVTATFDTKDFMPLSVALDPSTHTAYVTSSQLSSMSVIDLASRTVTAAIDIGGRPKEIAIDPSTHTAYVTNGEGRSVSVVDLGLRRVTATIDIGGSQSGVAVDPATHTLYAVSKGSVPSVQIIDTVSRRISATVRIEDSQPWDPSADSVSVSVDPSTHAAYVVDTTGRISVIDP